MLTIPTEQNTPPLIPRLLPTLTTILSTYPNDPSIIVSLAIKLLRPVKFKQAMQLASEDSLVLALQSPAPSANILAMTVLAKAAESTSDVAILSIMSGVVAALITTWLSSPSVEVGEMATRVLGDLLDMDCDRKSISTATINASLNGKPISIRPQSGQGLLWRRVFQDKKIYSSIFSLCSLHTTDTTLDQLDERQRSLAQARVLRILPRLAALDFSPISHSTFPEVERSHNVPEGKESLLYFACVLMVDKTDVLMHITLVDFFREFLDTLSLTDISGSTMEYLDEFVTEAAREDEALSLALNELANSPSTSPELLELLHRLNTT
jgi:hypothetical protein